MAQPHLIRRGSPDNEIRVTADRRNGFPGRFVVPVAPVLYEGRYLAVLSLVLPEAVRPVQSGTSADTRRLGILITRVELIVPFAHRVLFSSERSQAWRTEAGHSRLNSPENVRASETAGGRSGKDAALFHDAVDERLSAIELKLDRLVEFQSKQARSKRGSSPIWPFLRPTPKLWVYEQYSPRPLRVPRRKSPSLRASDLPTFSLVTPSYNQGLFIADAIKSVRRQPGVSINYHVQDGKSLDSTIEVLKQFGASLSWASEPDDGQADAIMRAFARTPGEIMGWLNSDDMLLPGALARVGQVFAEKPDVDIVYATASISTRRGLRSVGASCHPTTPRPSSGVTTSRRKRCSGAAAFGKKQRACELISDTRSTGTSYFARRRWASASCTFRNFSVVLGSTTRRRRPASWT